MANTKKPAVDKKELEKAQKLWEQFTEWSKWGVIVTVAILSLMAITLL